MATCGSVSREKSVSRPVPSPIGARRGLFGLDIVSTVDMIERSLIGVRSMARPLSADKRNAILAAATAHGGLGRPRRAHVEDRPGGRRGRGHDLHLLPRQGRAAQRAVRRPEAPTAPGDVGAPHLRGPRRPGTPVLESVRQLGHLVPDGAAGAPPARRFRGRHPGQQAGGQGDVRRDRRRARGSAERTAVPAGSRSTSRGPS